MKALRLVFGSIVVYLSVATLHACSATSPNVTVGATGPGGSDGNGGSGGRSAVSSSGHGGSAVSTSGMSGIMSSAGGEMVSTTGDVFDSGIFDALTDPVDKASADPASGSRLKAYYQTGADGSKAYIAGAWHDSQRNEDCSFAHASDGLLRCLPFVYGQYVTDFFDSICSQPLVSEVQGCAPPYAVAYSTGGPQCQAWVQYKIYPVSIKATPAIVYSIAAGGMCKGAPPNPAAVYHLTGPAIPPSSFVGGSYQHD